MVRVQKASGSRKERQHVGEQKPMADLGSGVWPLLFKDSLGTDKVGATFSQQILIECPLRVRHVVDTSVVM